MAASLPRPGTRLFRTYAARGVQRSQPNRGAVQWFQPPDPKRAFSSSFSGNDQSPSVSSDDSDDPDDPDDPDFPGSPSGKRRKRSPDRASRQQRTLTATQRLRPRPPQKCSTPCGRLRPPPFSCNPGRFSPDLSVCGQSRGSNELGTSASLFSSPASPGAPDSPDGAPAVPRGSHLPAASLDLEASLPCPREAATDEGRFTSLAGQSGADIRSAAFVSPVDSGTTKDNEFGTDGKNVKESCRERQQVGNRLKGPGLTSMRKRRATDQTVAPQGADQTDYGRAGVCKDRCVPGQISRPKRTEPLQRRKRQKAMGASARRYQQSKKKKRASVPSPDLRHIHETSSWAKTRASFSFHKKKVITNLSEECSSQAAGSPSRSLLSEYSTPCIRNRANSTVSSCHSSSMYLLSPLKTLQVTDKKPSYAEKVYGECNQEGPIPFHDCLSKEKLEHCKKIGEGVFGEVFETITDQTPVALKIIAIEGPDLVNGSHQKTFEEILPEIIISKELSLLSDEVYNRTEGFIGLNSVHCVQGPYPPLLLKAWDRYNATKKSANDRPDFFQEDQLFIILEFEFGGVDLEQMRGKLSSVATAKSILHQITASLAVAEASLHFEHRDLHWGNVLLKKTNLKEIHYTLNGKTSTIPTRGLQVNIIDYTLSRLERDGIVVFCDISNEEDLFTGEGDYQFEIYRLMRKENKNCWGEYHPYNNVLWLHYLTDKILNHMSFKTKCHTTAMKQVKERLEHFHRTVLTFSSATDLLCRHSLFK
ncbi:serine/threonine-protein kinase haspin [Phodopus roborovskii]|uniref:Serine/threonine-protein kinase haspin n=1 Tax=Phodopus roborovskii TaxID=109678 RepID=A0AAU9YZT3_PHORO|nr:serine/threonine-protein kinase haspin [Phodopus roborovskii]CAH6785964.1 Haspin [Phodopus roborovskii]